MYWMRFWETSLKIVSRYSVYGQTEQSSRSECAPSTSAQANQSLRILLTSQRQMKHWRNWKRPTVDRCALLRAIPCFAHLDDATITCMATKICVATVHFGRFFISSLQKSLMRDQARANSSLERRSAIRL